MFITQSVHILSGWYVHAYGIFEVEYRPYDALCIAIQVVEIASVKSTIIASLRDDLCILEVARILALF